MRFITPPTWAALRPFILAIVALLSATASAIPASAEKHLIRGNAGEPKSLDPHRATGVWENQVIGDMLMGLYTEDASAKPILGAAREAMTSADGRTWTFKIRAHTWSDGVPVTSDDFVFAFRRILDPAFAAEYREILYPVKNALKVSLGELPADQLGIRAPDPETLIIELENPAPYLPQLLTHYTTFPMPKHAIQKFESDWIKPGNMVSNGPYVLKEWRPHDHITLVKNARFYDAANVSIDRVTFLPIEDDLSALKRFRAGELDMQYRWPLTEVKWLRANIPAETRSYTELSVSYFVFNTTKKPFDDLRVRTAVSELIDRDLIAKDIYFDAYGAAATGLVPKGVDGFEYSAQVPYADLSMDARQANARKLLADAGFSAANPLKFSYNYINFPDNKRAAVAIQAMLREAGVLVELKPSEPKVHYDALKTKNFETAHAGWVFDFADAKNILYLFESTTGQQNYPGYNNPEFDSLMRQADAEPNGALRAKLLGQAHALLMRDLPVAPNFFPYRRPLVKPYVLNFQENPRDVVRSRWLDLGQKPGEGTSGEGSKDGAPSNIFIIVAGGVLLALLAFVGRRFLLNRRGQS